MLISFEQKFKNTVQKKPLDFFLVFFLSVSFIYSFSTLLANGNFVGGLADIGRMHLTYTTDIISKYAFGASLMNASIIAMLFYGFLKVIKAQLSGASLMALFMVYAYTFIGINIYGTLIVMAGATVSLLIQKHKFKDLFTTFCFATPVSPLFSYLLFGSSFDFGTSIPIAIVSLFLIGVLSHELGVALMKITEGYTLGNTGIALGFPMMLVFGGLSYFGVDSTNVSVDPTYLWEPLVLYSSILVVNFLIMFKYIPLNKGYKDVLKHSGKIPTDYFVVSGVREGFFNALLLNTFSNIIIVVFMLIKKDNIGLSSFSLSGYLQVIAFSWFGKHLYGALGLSIGFMSLYLILHLVDYDDIPNSGVILGSLFMSWLLCPIIIIDWWAPILAGFIHVFLIEEMKPTHDSIYLYNNGFATFINVLVLFSASKALKLFRKRKSTYVLKSKYNHDMESDEKQKIIQIQQELIMYFMGKGVGNVSTIIQINEGDTYILIRLGGYAFDIAKHVLDEINSYERDEIIEHDYWSTLGQNAQSINLPLIGAMIDSAKIERKATSVKIHITRKF